MEIITLIALSLSMDAFSLSLIYGIRNIGKKTVHKLSLTVGLFHFIMPLIGMRLSILVLGNISKKIDIIFTIIILIIGLQMIIDSFKKENNLLELNLIGIIIFSILVSIDSFVIGIGIISLTNKIFLSSTLFMIFSSLLTYLGLKLGNKINQIFGNIATIIGGIILIAIGILNIYI